MQIPSNQLTFTLSSIWTHGNIGEFCNDGNLATVCHTMTGDTSPTLTITSASPLLVDKVVIYNRQDCCTSLIVGATIEVRKVDVVQWQSIFVSDKPVYTFAGASRVYDIVCQCLTFLM